MRKGFSRGGVRRIAPVMIRPPGGAAPPITPSEAGSLPRNSGAAVSAQMTWVGAPLPWVAPAAAVLMRT